MELTATRLRELLTYHPDTGNFFWKSQRGGRGSLTRPAGAMRGDGYVVICIDGVNHRAHRLAWMYTHGKMPRRTIDHINGVKSDNRIANLRDVSIRLNSHNQHERRPRSDQTAIGVELRQTKSGPRWRVRIGHFGRLVPVGTYLSLDEAKAAYAEAKSLMHVGSIPLESPQTTEDAK